jgi:hypothetical protein
MKSKKTFSEEYQFLNSNIPTAIEDRDFSKLPLPPSLVEDLFGENVIETEVTQIDIDEFFNSLSVENDEYNSNDYRVNKLVNRSNSKFKRMMEEYGRDFFGLYFPFHYYFKAGKWGIYLFVDLIEERAEELYYQQHWLLGSLKHLTLQEIKLLYYYAVYRHEFFHYQTEVFATNAEVLSEKPLYINYNNYVKEYVRHTEDWLEEALAEASVLKSTLVIKKAKIDRAVLKAIYQYDLQFMPPGYRDYACNKYGGPEKAHQYLASQIVQTRVNPNFIVPGNNTIKKEFAHDYKKVPVYLVRFNRRIRIQ